MSIPQQALVQFAGMAVAFGLGWLAHWPGRKRDMDNCPHHGWDESRQLVVSWLHELEVNGRMRMHCAYCGRLFPAEAREG